MPHSQARSVHVLVPPRGLYHLYRSTLYQGPFDSLPSQSDFFVFLRNLPQPPPFFVHGKRNGGRFSSQCPWNPNINAKKPLYCFSQGLKRLRKKEPQGSASTSQSSRALHADRPIRDTHYSYRNEKPSLPGTKMKHKRRRQQAQAALRMKGNS